MKGKTLLFINGEAPKKLPAFNEYEFVICTDGALHYLLELDFPLSELDFICGDFDSHHGFEQQIVPEKFIYTPDQDKTDFEKVLEIILEKSQYEVDVFGGSGKEQDHFLGNISVAHQFRTSLKITFYDEFSKYFFIPESFKISSVKNKMISLYPFPITNNVTTKGLNWNLNDETLNLTGKISTRNFAAEDVVEINFTSGALLLFINHVPK